MYSRMKRVTDPLDERVKARIFGRDRIEPGYLSSGSEHSAHDGDDVISPSLSSIFFGFNGDTEDSVPEGAECPEDNAECDPSISETHEVNVDFIESILRDQRDSYQEVLLAHAMRALQVFSCAKSSKQAVRRNVMAYLRNFGHDAAICKTKWESSGGLTAGNHEFIDVIRPEQNVRYLVELDFVSEFEIARPTESYERLLKSLPAVFVGTSDVLKPILKVMSDGSKRSLKRRGLLLPPWRKYRFMQNKWLGAYRRTTNIFPASFSSVSPVHQLYPVKCRAVGFDAGVNGGSVLLPAAARTH
ncbi:hypothetical protein F511_04785 [Dorcoceras hygrometricum]|uniref:DUF506 family protein n=1 Tax=Dorcoceras hygrometricum TaxID=472368 RepID=A0A2Z7AV12_9LAMI|nr:hypothetical protein F511_04785 [Dorcoceras hygrometricum]